jgi:hypothetical protein
MSALSIQVPFPVFQGRDGQPLDNGYVWIGEPNLNPQTNPVVAYYDAALTIVAPQPLRTLNGYVSRAGTPAQVYVDGVNFSILVQDSKGTMVYNFPEGTGISPDAEGVTYNPPFTGGVQTNVEAKLAQTVSVKDFGAVGNGVTDDTAAIQAAVNAARVVNFESLTYKIAGTVEIPDNTWLCGKPGTEFLGIMTPQGTPPGGYPNQMFRNADTTGGNQNIAFTNIKFNFAKGAYSYDIGPTLTSINSLLFVLVENLVFEDCEFFDFVTNYNNTLTGKALLAFGMAQFDNCARISFERISSENIREEGFNFYECFQVSFNEWRGRGTAVNTSSHAGIWYCDVVSITNARFTHTGGSVINCCSRNVLYENITVNENQTQAGRGFDFGNELDARAFEIGNISVVGCTLNVGDYGIYVQGGNVYNDICESINVENNRIYVKKGTAGVSYGVRVLSPKAATIQNNFIYMNDVSAVGEGVCVILSLLTTTQDYDSTTNIQVIGNYLRGLTGVSLQQNNDTSIDGLYIENNTFLSQDIGALASFSGASVFVYFRNNSTAVSDFDISNVYVQNNNCWNLGGGYFVMSIDDPAEIVLNNINIMNNRFVGHSANMDRGFAIHGGTSGSGNADVRLCYNTIENGNTMTFNYMKYALMERNVCRWSTEFTPKRVQINNHNGTFEMVSNRFYNVSQSLQEDVTQTTSTFDILAITGNSSKNAVGTLAWSKSTLPANTVLPN